MRFSSASRLNSSHDFAAIFDHGQRHYLKGGMYISLRNQLTVARLGLIIAKKKIRKATARNYLKRLQRECFRVSQQAIAGYDIIFVANHKLGQLCQNEWFAYCQADWRFLAKRLASA